MLKNRVVGRLDNIDLDAGQELEPAGGRRAVPHACSENGCFPGVGVRRGNRRKLPQGRRACSVNRKQLLEITQTSGARKNPELLSDAEQVGRFVVTEAIASAFSQSLEDIQLAH